MERHDFALTEWAEMKAQQSSVCKGNDFAKSTTVLKQALSRELNN